VQLQTFIPLFEILNRELKNNYFIYQYSSFTKKSFMIIFKEFVMNHFTKSYS